MSAPTPVVARIPPALLGTAPTPTLPRRGREEAPTPTLPLRGRGEARRSPRSGARGSCSATGTGIGSSGSQQRPSPALAGAGMGVRGTAPTPTLLQGREEAPTWHRRIPHIIAAHRPDPPSGEGGGPHPDPLPPGEGGGPLFTTERSAWGAAQQRERGSARAAASSSPRLR